MGTSDECLIVRQTSHPSSWEVCGNRLEPLSFEVKCHKRGDCGGTDKFGAKWCNAPKDTSNCAPRITSCVRRWAGLLSVGDQLLESFDACSVAGSYQQLIADLQDGWDRGGVESC